MECEYPFLETSSAYTLEENMTFMADMFLHRGGMGFREGGYGGGSSRMGERFDYPSYPDMGEMGERRRRDYRGRYM